MFYQSCGSVGDSYEEHATELITDYDEINLAGYQYYQLEDYYFDWQVEWAIAQAERCEMNASITEKTYLIDSGLWAGAEQIVLSVIYRNGTEKGSFKKQNLSS
jgi:hypothetical protein